MDKIARVRQEIERLKEICTAQIKANPGQTLPFVMEMTGYDKLLSFLDTLSKEPDIPEFPETFEICLYDGRTPDNEKCTECSTTCSVRKEELDKSLEEEIEMEWDSFNKHLAKYDDGSDDVVWLNWNSFKEIARYFAQWGAEHLKK